MKSTVLLFCFFAFAAMTKSNFVDAQDHHQQDSTIIEWFKYLSQSSKLSCSEVNKIEQDTIKKIMAIRNTQTWGDDVLTAGNFIPYPCDPSIMAAINERHFISAILPKDLFNKAQPK